MWAVAAPQLDALRRRLDRVADVLAIAQPREADDLAFRIEHGIARTGIGPRLLAADIELGGAVDRIAVGRRRAAGQRVQGRLDRLGRLRRRRRRFEVFGQSFAPALAAEAALAIAAEAGGGVEQVGRIDPHHAGLDLRGDFERAIDVLGPHRGGEAVAGVVGERDRFVGRAEGHRRQHRPEDLLARQDRRRLDLGDQRRRIETAAFGQRSGRAPHLRALAFARLDQPLDPFELDRRDDRADVDRLVERVADPQRLHPRPQLGVHPLGDRFGDQQPRAGAAHLALVEPDRVDDALDRAVEIGILEDDERRLAAELERQLLARAGGRLTDGAADLGRAGEGDLVDVVVFDQRRAGRAVAGDDVDDAGRQPDLDADLGEGERGQRRELGRLQHDGVSCGQRRRDLPRQHQQREVPRDDLAADADRLEGRETRRRSARPSRRGDRNGARPAARRRRAIRGSACRCRGSPAPRAAARASGYGGRARRASARARRRSRADQDFSALRAAATAAATSASVPWLTRAMRSPRAGLKTSNNCPGGVNAPAMKWPKPPLCAASQARACSSLSGARP